MENSFEEFIKEKYDQKDPYIQEIIERSSELLLSSNKRFFKHQNFIHNLIKQYDKLFLYHETGTGKTCSALGAAENFKQYYENDKLAINYINNDPDYLRRTYVLVSGETLVDEFRTQLVCVCSDIYLKSLQDANKYSNRYINILIKKYYSIRGYESFVSRSLDRFMKSSLEPTGDSYRQFIHQNYDNTFFIIDEVHNLRMDNFTPLPFDRFINNLRIRTAAPDKTFIYSHIYNILHTAKNIKVMLLSATPMINSTIDLASTFNLINPMNLQLPYEEITMTYSEIEPYFRGLISYVESNKSNENSAYVTNDENSDYFYLLMRDQQLQRYLKISTTDDKFRQTLRQNSNIYLIDKNINKTLENINTITELGNYSTKFEFILNNIDSAKNNVYVFSSYVTFGVEALGKCLEKLKGYEEFKIGQDIKTSKIICQDDSKTTLNLEKKKRYVVLMAKSDVKGRINNILKVFNHPANRYGEYIKAILVSPIGREGISFRNVTQIYSLEPDWNNSNIHQGISRAIRVNSHDDLKGEEFTIEIYKLVSVLNQEVSIDMKLIEYSYFKDIEFNRLTGYMKRAAVDSFIDRRQEEGLDKYTSFNYLFNLKSIYTISELSTLTNIQEKTLIKDLNMLIDQQQMFVNRIGIQSFLSRNSDTYFLTSNLNNGYGKSYYSNKQVIEYKPNIDKLLEKEYKNSPNSIQYVLYNVETELINKKRLAQFEEYYFYILPGITDLIENYRLTGNIDANIDDYLSNDPTNSVGIVHDLFRLLPSKSEHGAGSRLMKTGNNLRVYISNEDSNSFRDTVPYETSVYSELIEGIYRSRFEHIMQKQLYGMINPDINIIDETLKIVHNDITRTTRIDDKRYKSTGRVCKTIEFPNIIKYMLYLYEDNNITNKEELLPPYTITFDDALYLIDNEPMHLIADDYNEDEIMFIGNWLNQVRLSNIDKSIACEMLYNVMYNNNLLLYAT